MLQPPDDQNLPARVVVVDDSDLTSDVLVRHMRLEGHDAIAYLDPVEGLKAIKADPPDVVLLDVMMPGINGMQVLEELRSFPATAELPVIMLTALSETQDIVRGLELGANDYLVKPPQYEVLAARVRTQISLKRLQDQRRRDLAELRELNAIKDKFLQIAAHDLRNPVNNIIIGLEILSRTEPHLTQQIPDFDTVISMMQGATDVMRSIINDFLDLQAIRTGKVELRRQPVALNDLISSVIQQYQAYAESKEVALRVQLEDSLPQTQADPDRLVQVVGNLVSNAIKFSSTGASVGVRTHLMEGQIVVEVADNGPGIREEELPLLFQEFARLSNKPTGGEKSSGVGLSIAKHLVELHGGSIGVQSVVGKGSLFWFSLPVVG